jgi:hypothetical protein
MRTFTSAAAVLTLLAQVNSAQNMNTDTTIKASSFVGEATSNVYPPSSSE